jgi:hypothetical protein
MKRALLLLFKQRPATSLFNEASEKKEKRKNYIFTTRQTLNDASLHSLCGISDRDSADSTRAVGFNSISC